MGGAGQEQPGVAQAQVAGHGHRHIAPGPEAAQIDVDPLGQARPAFPGQTALHRRPGSPPGGVVHRRAGPAERGRPGDEDQQPDEHRDEEDEFQAQRAPLRSHRAAPAGVKTSTGPDDEAAIGNTNIGSKLTARPLTRTDATPPAADASTTGSRTTWAPWAARKSEARWRPAPGSPVSRAVRVPSRAAASASPEAWANSAVCTIANRVTTSTGISNTASRLTEPDWGSRRRFTARSGWPWRRR